MLIKVSVNDGPRAVADLAFTAGASFGLEMAKRAMAEAHADKDDPTEGNAA
jgi:hypothetical protein